MINKLSCALSNCYAEATAYELVSAKWTNENKTIGQCAVTALIVNDYLKGNIKKCVVDGISHYYNEIDGIIYDLTASQFNHQVDYINSKNKTRAEILANQETKNRYEMLLAKVKIFLEKIAEIESQIASCNKCSSLVEKFTNNTSISYGKNTDIIILGEAPANNGWRKSGKAWHDVNQKILQSGKILEKLLNIIDLSLEETTFIEAIKCFPVNRKHLKTCNINCQKFLNQQLSLLNPRLVIALGDFATRSIIKTKYQKFGDIVGKIQITIIDNKEIKVLPIYHPSPISPVGYKGNVPIFEKLKSKEVV